MKNFDTRAEVANFEKNIRITCSDNSLVKRYFGGSIQLEYPGAFRKTYFKFFNVKFSNMGQPFEGNSAFIVRNGEDLSDSFVRYCSFLVGFYGGVYLKVVTIFLFVLYFCLFLF